MAYPDSTNPREEARDLALTYRFLARALSDTEVSEDFLDALKNLPTPLGCDLDGFIDQLAHGSAAHWHAELAADHAACLLGMSASPVSPYESVYTSDNHLMMQDARDQVVRDYAAQGLAALQGQRIPEDHIALELEFMSELLGRSAAQAESAQAYEDFMRNHALRWMPQFCRDLERRASTAFYRGIAQMLHGLLQSEAERLGA